MDKPRKMRGGWPLGLLALVIVGLAVPLVWFVAVRLEGEPPAISMDGPSPLYLGKSAEIAVSLSDSKSGLRRLQAGLNQDGKEFVLADASFPTSGLFGLGETRSDVVRLMIDPAALRLSDGKAVLRITLWDYSWRNWWHGNTTDVRHEVVIDTRPPAIEILTPQNYVNQGGTGLAIYRLSEPCPTSGVRVGDNLFPGYSGYYGDNAIHIAFFALGYKQPAATEIMLEAKDQAGNGTRTKLPCHFRKKVFKKDTLTVNDNFIRQILPEFQPLLPAGLKPALKDQFLYINRDLRQANYGTIVEATRKTEATMLWKGVFLRLPNSAPRAGFADHRTYYYEGKQIDQQDHLGVDLASLAHAPVPAANSGVVVYTGFIGIYGQTVILDHGFGLFSMYSHMSQIVVKPGDRVAKEDLLGNTGSTGLAGGDHLHFSILVHNTFADPVEWWDDHWINDNIMLKLDSVQAGSSRPS